MKPTTPTLQLFIFGILFILSACGGGSSGSAGTPPDNGKGDPPVANAGADQLITMGQGVQLDGSLSTDSDGTISTYQWSQINGTSVTLSDTTSPTPSFTAPLSGARESLTFQLVVTDNDGNTDNDTVSITLNVPPQADAGIDQQVLGGDTVSLSGSSSDADGSVMSHTWQQTGGSVTVVLNSTSSLTPNFVAPDVTDTLTFALTVQDNDGGETTDEVQIHITAERYRSSFNNLSGWTFDNDVPNSTSNWQILGGELNQLNVVETTQAFDESYHLGTFGYLDNSAATSWTNYYFSAEVTPLTNQEESEGNDVGLMFYYNPSNDSYYRLTLNTRYGFTRLEKKVNGNFSTLAVDGRGYTENITHLLEIEVFGGVIHAYINDEAVFSVRDTSLSSGTIGLYCQDKAKFDNVLVTDSRSGASIVITEPLGYGIATTGGTTTLAASANVREMPSGGKVEFILDNLVSIESGSSGNPYTATFTNVAQGNHTVSAVVRDDQGNELARDTNEMVGIRGNYYIAMGNSITNGEDDENPANNVSSDGRIVSIQGYEARLNDKLTDTSGIPHLVINEGVGGDQSADTLSRLSSILSRHPKAGAVLVLIGTNDSSSVDPAVFETRITAIADQIVAAGKDCWLAEILPVYDSSGNPVASRNNRIVQYNTRIRTLAAQSSTDSIFLGPDLYNLFLGRQYDYYSADGVHPNDTGYEAMAEAWHDALLP